MEEYYLVTPTEAKECKDFIACIEKSLLSIDIPIDYARGFREVNELFADFYRGMLITILESPVLVKRLSNRSGVQFEAGNEYSVFAPLTWGHKQLSGRKKKMIEDSGGVYKPSKQSALSQVKEALKASAEIEETQHTVGRPRKYTIDEAEEKAQARLKKRKEQGII